MHGKALLRAIMCSDDKSIKNIYNRRYRAVSEQMVKTYNPIVKSYDAGCYYRPRVSGAHTHVQLPLCFQMASQYEYPVHSPLQSPPLRAADSPTPTESPTSPVEELFRCFPPTTHHRTLPCARTSHVTSCI